MADIRSVWFAWYATLRPGLDHLHRDGDFASVAQERRRRRHPGQEGDEGLARSGHRALLQKAAAEQHHRHDGARLVLAHDEGGYDGGRNQDIHREVPRPKPSGRAPPDREASDDGGQEGQGPLQASGARDEGGPARH